MRHPGEPEKTLDRKAFAADNISKHGDMGETMNTDKPEELKV